MRLGPETAPKKRHAGGVHRMSKPADCSFEIWKAVEPDGREHGPYR